MRILVTGARGKVGAATVAALADAGHDVTAADLGAPLHEAQRDAVPYLQADLTDAGDAFAVMRDQDAVVHAAAIPDPIGNPAHRVFQNNLIATFNTLEAAVRLGVRRFVNISSETVPGYFFPERPFLPDYLPVDEQHPPADSDRWTRQRHRYDRKALWAQRNRSAVLSAGVCKCAPRYAAVGAEQASSTTKRGHRGEDGKGDVRHHAESEPRCQGYLTAGRLGLILHSMDARSLAKLQKTAAELQKTAEAVERAQRHLEAAKIARSQAVLDAVEAGQKQTEIAEKLGLSRESVRQMLREARIYAQLSAKVPR
jgi:NAD(P)-dependent dehydrogenase (short-subunit alcohol dehydrogenase family)